MFIYKKVKTTSQSQLRLDFGEFPPSPLGCREDDNQFNIVRLGGLANLWFTPSRIIRSMLSRDARRGHCEKSIISEKSVVIFQEIRIKFSEFYDSFLDLSIPLKVVFGFIILFAFPIVLVFLIFSLLRFCFKIVRMKKIGDGAFGFFSPLTLEYSEIVIKPFSIIGSGIPTQCVVSHEHIHLLQHHIFPERPLVTEQRLMLRKRCENLLNLEDLNSDRTFYLLSVNEVEARLHELVVGYYRAFGGLPTDYLGFLKLVLGCEVLGPVVSSLSTISRVVLPDVSPRPFSCRVSTPSTDIATNLLYFKDTRNGLRYVFEVLSVMYGNLLILYGDSQTAESYFLTIDSRGLYDQIYGVDSYSL